MKGKIYGLIAFIGMFIAAIFVMPEVANATNLSPNIPAGYDEPGKYPEGKVQNVYYYSNETRSSRKLVVYTPPGYSPNKKYPVIYSVHGINNTPESIFAFWCVKANTIADNLIGQGKIQPVIIVAFDNNNINSHNELFYNVMPFVESHYPIIKDADHRGIYGYSMGGGVTFAEGMGNLDTFHHVCPTSATPFNHPSDRNMFTEEAKRKIKTLVLSCGTIDWCGFYNANKASHDYCDATGFNHYWLSVPGGNHDGDVWKPAMWYFLQLAFPANGSPDVSSDNTSVPGETAKLADGWYYIKNENAQKYLQVEGNSAKSLANVELRSGNKSEGQKWYLKNLGDGYVTLKSALGEYMLYVNEAANKDNANIQIYNAHSENAQQFMIKSTGKDGSYVVATKCSNLTKVLDDFNKDKSDGVNVCQWSYNGQANQRWSFEPVKTEVPGNTITIQDGWYKIKNIFANKYLQVKDNQGKTSANVELKSKENSDGQKWYVKNEGNGYITIKSALGEYMVDVSCAEDKDGANIQIFDGYSGDAQKFMLKQSDTNGAYVVATKCSSLTKVLDDFNNDKSENADVCQWSYNGHENQRWSFEPVKPEAVGSTITIQDGWYKIKNVFANKYLQVKDNQGKPSANVELKSKENSDGQKWYVKNVGNGYIKIKSALGEYMIDVSCAEDKDGANIQIFDGYSGDAQQFMLKQSDANGEYIIATKCSNLTKVLDDDNYGQGDGSNISQWSNNGQANQKWIEYFILCF